MKKVLQQTLFRLKTFLLLAVMFIVGSSAAWAQEEPRVTFDLAQNWGGNTKTEDNFKCSRSAYTQYGTELWQATNFIKVEFPDDENVTKIVLRGFTRYNGTGSISLQKSSGTFEGSVEKWTSTDDATWYNTGSASYVQFNTTYGNDFYIRYVDVYVETVDDGSVKSTFNFNQASVPFVNAAGVAGNLQGGNRPSIGDVFTAPSGGATLTFNYVGESWSNSAQRLRLDSNASFTIAAPEGFEMTKIVFTTDINTMTFTSKSGLTGNGSTIATWEGQSESETFTISALSFIQNIKVTMVPVAEEGEITYTIDLVDAPTGAYVTLDGQRFEDDGTYPVEKSLGKNDLEAFEPEGYYAEVEYTRDNHTYTVTYKAYNYYDVTVTGTTDPAAGVVYNNQTYGNGTRIETKDVLTESSVKAADVVGYNGTVSMTGNTYSVDYQEKLDFVIMTNTGQTTISKDGFTITGGGIYSENCLNLWSSWKLTVTSSSFPIRRIELEELNGKTITASSSPEGYKGNNVWEGTPTNSVVFSATNSGDFCIKSVHVYLYKPQPVNYTIEFVNAPDEAYITLDGQTIHKVNEGYEVAKVLDASSVTYAYEPTGYYADVTYDEENHKFTVTYVEGYRVEFGTEFSGQTITTDGITYDRGWSGGELYQTSYSGYGRIYVKSETKSIKKVEIACNGSASPVIEEFGVGSVAANGNTAVWTAPEDGVVQDLTFYSTSGSSLAVSKVTVYYNELPNIDYPVVIAVDGTLPADFTPTVTVDGQNFSANDTYSTPKTLTKDNVSATLPENGDWYYDVDYAEATNTFTVTYKEYLHYIVSVVGCEDETAGVRNGSNTFHDGEKINVKEALTAGALTAVTVNGYDVTAPVVGEGTVTVTYAVAGLVEYAVTITGMPEGASVKIEDQVFTENTDNGVHQSNKTLSSEVVTIQNCPETHYTNESYEWYNEEDKAFNIAFTPYLVYTVAVDEASAYQGDEAGVKIKNGSSYTTDQTIYVKTALTEENVEAVEVDGYTGTVSLSGNVFIVSYVKDAFIKFDASAIAGYGSVNETKDGVTLQCWDSDDYFTVGEQTNYSYILTSTGAPIVKVEIDYKWPYGDHLDYCNTGSLNAGLTVWTGSTNELRLKNSNDWGIDVNSLKVYLAQATTYHVNIAGMPAQGATVIVNNDYTNGYYTADGNYDYVTFDELNESNIIAIAPQSHQVDKAYDESTKTFSVNYTALPTYEYTFVVEPYEDTNLKVYIDGEAYGDGVDYYTFYRELTLDDIETPEYEGYYANPSVKIEDFGSAYLVTVIYTPLPAIAISDKAQDKDGNYWTTFSIDKPISLAEGFTPCIVTAAENGVLTLKEFEAENNETVTTYAFSEVYDLGDGSLLIEESNDITASISGDYTISGFGSLIGQNIPCTITFNAPVNISKIIVTPLSTSGYGPNCTVNGGEVVAIDNEPYTFDVNSKTCTIAFSRSQGSYYVSKIEVVTGGTFIPVIPANTGILVKSSESAKIPYTIHADDAETVEVNGNLLVAACDPKAVWEDDNKLFYKLSWKNSSYEDLGFYWGVEGGHSITPSQNKAYLVLDAPAGAESNRAFVFGGYEEVLTGIDSVSAVSDAPIFNLQGKRVSRENLSAGVYVQDGKKFIVK